MVTFNTNFMCKTTIGFLYRPLILWVDKSSKLACAKGRDYSSSLPIRYVRKKMTESENLEAYSVPRKLPEDVKLKKHKIFEEKVESRAFDGPRRRDRNFNLAEHERLALFNSCGRIGEEEIDVGFLAIDNHMEEPDELSEKHKCTLNELSNGKYQKHASGNRQDAERFAIQLLSTRAFTASELRKKLQGRNFPLETVDMVVGLPKQGIH
ncbi:hypothetical protein Leryth_012006 [Lithospermum erythrorhizon]|nr:hypothetical protein Leryth_012006 [Lithospermum erythrorhizon]